MPATKRRESLKGQDSLVEPDKVIEALVRLKKLRKYPALPGEIGTALSVSKSRSEKLKEYLKRLGKEGILMASRKGRYGAYMLAGEDPRYAAKAENALKFELLGEIEELKARLLEFQATAHMPEPPREIEQVKADEYSGLEEGVLQTIKELSRSKNRRTLDLWEVRKALPKVPRETLDLTLERLGSAWLLELQLVQDSTKLSDEERSALLRLTDGSLVGAVAIAAD